MRCAPAWARPGATRQVITARADPLLSACAPLLIDRTGGGASRVGGGGRRGDKRRPSDRRGPPARSGRVRPTRGSGRPGPPSSGAATIAAGRPRRLQRPSRRRADPGGRLRIRRGAKAPRGAPLRGRSGAEGPDGGMALAGRSPRTSTAPTVGRRARAAARTRAGDRGHPRGVGGGGDRRRPVPEPSPGRRLGRDPLPGAGARGAGARARRGSGRRAGGGRGGLPWAALSGVARRRVVGEPPSPTGGRARAGPGGTRRRARRRGRASGRR